MTSSASFARAILLAAIAFAPICATLGYAADRGGHDYVVDSMRASSRTGVLRECIRTGMPEAGAPAEECDGSTRAAAPAPAPVPAAPPTPEPLAAAPEPAPEPEPAAAAPAVAAPEPVAPEPAPRVARVNVNLSADADFGFGSAELGATGRAKLDTFAAQLKAQDYGTVHVVGHADRIGTQQYNHYLSLLRAQAVKDYLVSLQIDRARIETRGAGSSQPLTGPQDCRGLKKQALVDCLQPDRRVEADAEITKVVRN
jgi:OOP family OmpA-OmpF porin